MSTSESPVATPDPRLLPVGVARRVIESAVKASVVLSHVRTAPMPVGEEAVPIVSTVPEAGWVGAPGGRKPLTRIEWSAEMCTSHFPQPAKECRVSSHNKGPWVVYPGPDKMGPRCRGTPEGCS